MKKAIILFYIVIALTLLGAISYIFSNRWIVGLVAFVLGGSELYMLLDYIKLKNEASDNLKAYQTSGLNPANFKRISEKSSELKKKLLTVIPVVFIICVIQNYIANIEVFRYEFNTLTLLIVFIIDIILDALVCCYCFRVVSDFDEEARKTEEIILGRNNQAAPQIQQTQVPQVQRQASIVSSEPVQQNQNSYNYEQVTAEDLEQPTIQ